MLKRFSERSRSTRSELRKKFVSDRGVDRSSAKETRRSVQTRNNVNAPGAINVSPAGEVRIWVTGSLNPGGNLNLNGIPKNLAFLVTSSGWVNIGGDVHFQTFVIPQ